MTDLRQSAFNITLQDTLEKFNVLNTCRCLTIVAALLCALITLEPFQDLESADIRNVVSGSLLYTYAAFGVLALTAMVLAARDNILAIRTLWTPLHLCFLAWMAINIVLSENPGLSLQRFVLTASVMALAAMMPLLPPTQKHFNKSVGAAALIVLGLCYLGLIFAPELSIHNANDVAEPQLAGDWRGVFAHKNVASPVMVLLVYIGVYLMLADSLLTGLTIFVLAGVFVIFAGGKSAASLCLVIFVLTGIVSATKRLWLKRTICFVPLILMNLLSVGTVMNSSLKGITERLPIDSTFTGRTDVWNLVVGAIAEKPIFGHGHAVFWDNAANRITTEGKEWTLEAAHSHNSYLELALDIGLPGCALAILIFVISPLNNFHTIQSRGQDGPLVRLFLVMWMFAIYFGTTETFLLARQNPVWFLFLIAVAGLHYLSRYRTR